MFHLMITINQTEAQSRSSANFYTVLPHKLMKENYLI